MVIPPRRQVDVVSRTPLLPGRFAGQWTVDSPSLHVARQVHPDADVSDTRLQGHKLGPGVYVARTLWKRGCEI